MSEYIRFLYVLKYILHKMTNDCSVISVSLTLAGWTAGTGFDRHEDARNYIYF